jgi:hypothetical protein
MIHGIRCQDYALPQRDEQGGVFVWSSDKNVQSGGLEHGENASIRGTGTRENAFASKFLYILFLEKRKSDSIFYFYKKKPLLLLLSYLFFSSKVTHTKSIHKYTQPVMLTPCPPAARLTPISHAWTQA